MNKMILIFTLLLALVISVEPECKHYEFLDEETNKCVKVWKEEQFVNEDEDKCECFCKKGKTFNLETSSCQSNKTNEQEGKENGVKGVDDVQQKEEDDDG